MRPKFSSVFLLLLTFSLWAMEGEKAKNPGYTGNLWYSVRTVGYRLGYAVGEMVDNQGGIHFVSFSAGTYQSATLFSFSKLLL